MAKSGLGFRLVQISFRDFLSFDGCTAEKLRRRLLVIQYFPLEDYIDWLRKLMPPTTDIKSGL